MFGDALKIEMENRSAANKLHKAVMAAMPENPERGSYYWWAKICRQNTGAHFLDSGGVFGRHWSSLISEEEEDPIGLQFYDRKLEYASINLPHFLSTMLETDEIAEALEEFLYWIGTWRFPKEPWHVIIEALMDSLRMIHSYIPFKFPNSEDYGEEIIGGFWNQSQAHDLMRFQRDMSREEYITKAMENLPVKAVKLLVEEWLHDTVNPINVLRGDNIYNHENDLNQGFSYYPISENQDVYDQEYIIIQTHNGADHRGGYSDPVIARLRDVDYFYSWVCDFYCPDCQEQWEMLHFHIEALEEYSPAFDAVTVKNALKIKESIESGQQELLSSMPWEWPLPYSPKIAATLVKHYEKELELLDDPEDYEFPTALWKDELIEDDGSYPASEVKLVCPKCGNFTVQAYHSVYGF